MDARTCPACGQDNRCAVAAAGDRDVHCWCMDLPHEAELAPAKTADAACYCAACAARLLGVTAPG